MRYRPNHLLVNTSHNSLTHIQLVKSGANNNLRSAALHEFASCNQHSVLLGM